MKKKSVYIVCLIFLLLNVKAQEPPPFAQLQYNKLVYPGGDSSAMTKFFHKIDEMQLNKRKKVSIIHYGGSHVEAGHWDEIFQENLQNTITKFDGGGNWIFPFRLGDGNEPPFYRTTTTGKWKRCRSAIHKEDCSVYGVNGITVNNSQRYNDFTLKIAENFHHKNFTSLRVYHSFNAAYHFHIDVNSGLKYKQTQVRKEGYTLFEFDQPADSVSFKVEKTDTLATSEFTLYGFSTGTEDPGFYYACMGFNGASTQSYIDAQLLPLQLKTLQPDLIIFSIGVNDSHGPNFTRDYLINNYDSLIAMIKEVAPDCAIMFTTVTDNYIAKGRKRYPNKKMPAAHEAILELAKKHNAALWDMYMLMGGFKSMALWTKAGLAARDKVHFNVAGYHIMGKLMFEALHKSYNYNSLLKKKNN